MSLQFQLRRSGRFSRLVSSAIFEHFLVPQSSQFPVASSLLKHYRSFGSNSMDNDENSIRRTRSRNRNGSGSASDSIDEFFPLSNSKPPRHPLPESSLNRSSREYRPSSLNRNIRESSPADSDEAPLQFLRRSAPSHLNKDATSEKDYSFLEKFKLGGSKENRNENSNINRENPQSNTSPHSPSESDHEKQQPPPEADQIFKKMKETGLIPNAVAMLDSLCKDGLVQEAMKLFGLMREKGTIPEVVMYTAVVEGFCKAEKVDDAIRIFRKMQSNGITPNAFSFTVLIQGLYKCDKFDDAIEFCLEMIEAGHSPNVTTFVGLVDGLCNEKGVEEARNIILTLRQKGFFVNDKAVREYLDKKAPFSPLAWEAIFGKKSPSQKLF